jgi:hypothetical protein
MNRDIDGLEDRIKANVSGLLRYSSRFWVSHFRDNLMNQCDHDALITELKKFLYRRLLFWLEVMSLLQRLT